MKNTLLLMAILSTIASANYKFENVQRVDEINATLQKTVENVSLTDGSLSVTKTDGTLSSMDLKAITPIGAVTDATFDDATNKLKVTKGDGSENLVDLTKAGTQLSTGAYDKATKEITLGLTDGSDVKVTLDIDYSDVGAVSKDDKRVVDVTLNADQEIIISYSDGTTKALEL